MGESQIWLDRIKVEGLRLGPYLQPGVGCRHARRGETLINIIYSKIKFKNYITLSYLIHQLNMSKIKYKYVDTNIIVLDIIVEGWSHPKHG